MIFFFKCPPQKLKCNVSLLRLIIIKMSLHSDLIDDNLNDNNSNIIDDLNDDNLINDYLSDNWTTLTPEPIDDSYFMDNRIHYLYVIYYVFHTYDDLYKFLDRYNSTQYKTKDKQMIAANIKTIIQKIMSANSFNVNDIIYQRNTYTSYLHLACEHKCSVIIQMLLQHPDINVNVRDHKGYTPLMILTDYTQKYPNSIWLVDLLLKHPKIEINIVDKYYRTALHHLISWANRVDIYDKKILKYHEFNDQKYHEINDRQSKKYIKISTIHILLKYIFILIKHGSYYNFKALIKDNIYYYKNQTIGHYLTKINFNDYITIYRYYDVITAYVNNIFMHYTHLVAKELIYTDIGSMVILDIIIYLFRNSLFYFDYYNIVCFNYIYTDNKLCLDNFTLETTNNILHNNSLNLSKNIREFVSASKFK